MRVDDEIVVSKFQRPTPQFEHCVNSTYGEETHQPAQVVESWAVEVENE